MINYFTASSLSADERTNIPRAKERNQRAAAAAGRARRERKSENIIYDSL
jgi:hypothetical protein